MSRKTPSETPRLKLEDYTFKQLRDPKLRKKILQNNGADFMHQKVGGKAGSVEITLCSKDYA